jgi:hypothetical protein
VALATCDTGKRWLVDETDFDETEADT